MPPCVGLDGDVLELRTGSECCGELVGLSLCLTHPVRHGYVSAERAMVCPDVVLGEHGWCSVLCVAGEAYLLADEQMITTTVGPRQQLEAMTYQ